MDLLGAGHGQPYLRACPLYNCGMPVCLACIVSVVPTRERRARCTTPVSGVTPPTLPPYGSSGVRASPAPTAAWTSSCRGAATTSGAPPATRTGAGAVVGSRCVSMCVLVGAALLVAGPYASLATRHGTCNGVRLVCCGPLPPSAQMTGTMMRSCVNCKQMYLDHRWVWCFAKVVPCCVLPSSCWSPSISFALFPELGPCAYKR